MTIDVKAATLCLSNTLSSSLVLTAVNSVG